MGFDLGTWKKEIKNSISGLKKKMQTWSANSIYSTLITFTLWPVVQAVARGDLSALMALGGVLGGLGSNLLANLIQNWKDKTSEQDLAREIEQTIQENPDVREVFDTLLKKLDTVDLAKAVLPESERQWFIDTLRQELQRLGNLPKFEMVLTDSIFQKDSPGAVAAAGPGATAIGNVEGDLYLGSQSKDSSEALRIYRQVLRNTFRHLPLRGVDVGASDPTAGQKRLELAQVYIDLDIKHQVPVSKTERNRKEIFDLEDRKLRPLGALEATIQNRHLVLLGDAGSGKSTFCHFLTICLASQPLELESKWIDRLPGWPENEADILPIFVVLRDFDAWLSEQPKKANPKDLWDFIRHRLDEQNLSSASEAIHEMLEKGRAILLFDGLDEIQTGKRVERIRAAVEAFVERYSKNRVVVTCRTLAYQEQAWQLKDFPDFELAPFDDEKIQRFVAAWYEELVRLGAVKQNEREGLRNRLLHALEQRPDLHELARKPLLLTVMALVHTHKGRLPEARALLYEESVDILLWRWDQLKAGLPGLQQLLHEANRSDVDLKRALWHLAFEAHKKGKHGKQGRQADEKAVADITEWQLQKKLVELHPEKSRDWANQVIQTIKLRAGLLVERAPEVYSFPHRTFQEFLAGAYLASQGDFAKKAAALLDDGAYWREVILLAVGKLVHHSGDTDKPLALVAELCPDKTPETDAGWRKNWLAGDALLEMGLNRVEESAFGMELAQRVRSRLVQLLKGGHLSPAERAAAGNSLARLGDPRFREDAWYLPADEMLGFVEIPEGPFTMGEGKEEHPLDLPTYYIARWPVTVAQFRAFVEDSGHKPEDPDSLRGPGNHPVRWVTWHEALKYCDWLTQKLRDWPETPPELARLLRKESWIVTLPSEAEWEKAARGEDGRIYPWGNEEPEPNRANYDKTGIGGPSAVGCFPAGASPYGCEDMAGNVWEWTRSLWGKDLEKPDYGYPYDPQDGRENLGADASILRVVRGGAFHDASRNLRCADRARYFPVIWDWYLGFRVALRPPL